LGDFLDARRVFEIAVVLVAAGGAGAYGFEEEPDVGDAGGDDGDCGFGAGPDEEGCCCDWGKS